MAGEKDTQSEDIVIENENSSPDLELKKLREKLKKCVSEKEEYLAGWQRAKADFINARKEDEKRLEDFKKYAEAGVASDFLEIADGFEKAFSEESWQSVDKAWQNGIKSLYTQFTGVLKKHNIEPIDAKGKEFNPGEHESFGEVDVENEKDDGIVMEEARKGYKINDKTLRPAQVKVGRYKSNQ